jgi:hypothetical protein
MFLIISDDDSIVQVNQWSMICYGHPPLCFNSIEGSSLLDCQSFYVFIKSVNFHSLFLLFLFLYYLLFLFHFHWRLILLTYLLKLYLFLLVPIYFYIKYRIILLLLLLIVFLDLIIFLCFHKYLKVIMKNCKDNQSILLIFLLFIQQFYHLLKKNHVSSLKFSLCFE